MEGEGPSSELFLELDLGMSQNYTTRGPQVLVFVFWVPILDPHPSENLSRESVRRPR